MYVMQVFRNDYDADALRLVMGGEASTVGHARNWARKMLVTIGCAILVQADGDHERRVFELREGDLYEGVVVDGRTIQTLINGRAA